MKRGFLMADKKRQQPQDNLGSTDPRMDNPIFSDGGNRLGSASGIPNLTKQYKVGETPGLSWAPVQDSMRNRWNTTSTTTTAPITSTPWKSTVVKPQQQQQQQQDKDESSIMTDEDDTVATGSTYPSTVSGSSSAYGISSLLATQPVLPHGKMMEAPRAALYDWYLKEHQTQAAVKECYYTWHNNGPPHERMFTSVLVCPVTGEVFASGKYGPKEGIKKRMDPVTGEAIEETRVYYGQRKDPITGAIVTWFTDKTSSQHGAAARAYDCFSLRRYKPLGMRSVHLGDEEPYMTEKDAPPLPTMPEDVRNRVEAQRRRIATLPTQAASINTPSPVAPKAALSAWYGTKPRAHQLSKHNYVSWNNRALPHLLKYTSIFVCPLSGEAFWSGKCGSVDSYEERNDINGNAVVWYNKKLLAEHAAAARAYDCWCLRLEGRQSNFLGQDQPYRTAKDAPPCPAMPTEAQEKVRQLQEEAKTRMPIPIMNPAPPRDMQSEEEEAQKDRDEYRAARAAQNLAPMDEEW